MAVNPFKKYRELARQKFSDIYVTNGDTLQLLNNKKVVCETAITETMTINEGVLFSTEFEKRRALGGLFLEKAG